MKKGFSEAIDEMRASAAEAAPAQLDGFEILAMLAARHGTDIQVLIKELSGSSALARIGRELLGFQFLAPSSRGRPADNENNWRMFTLVRVFRENGQSLDEAIASYLQMNGNNDPDDDLHEATKRQFNRLKKKWPAQPVKLVDLFVGPAPDKIPE